MSTEYDVAVIGAGVVGCAIARELAGYNLRVALIEARNDVGDATSKASTAILHTGFDATPGTLESKLVRRGYELWCDFAQRTQVAVDRTGALLVAWDEEQLQTLPTLAEKARANGYSSTRLVDAAQVYATVPDLGPGARGGLEVPDESVIDSWGAVLALATDAVNRGVVLHLSARVTGVAEDRSTLHTTAGDVAATWIVNAAGLGGDVVDAMFGHHRFTLHPRRGELFVFDKLARPKVPVIVLPVPSKVGKGVLISPTIYGNVMLGPTAEDMQDRLDTATTEAGFEFLLAKGRQLMPTLLDEEVTTTYAGLRAASDRSDFVIELDDRYLVAGCIRSTGVTASMAIAEHVVTMLRSAGLQCTEKTQLPAPPTMPYLGESGMRPYADEDRIAADPAYGDIICFCERVTMGEIRDALQATVPAHDLNGLRRRTRAQNGRCQGFFCGAKLREILDQGVER
jgi:glycerol-3-phosphate dehydrogenase